jgi:hypothetical protein
MLMPSFKDITVVAIHGNGGIEREIPALRKNLEALPGSRGLLITNELIDTDIPQRLVYGKLDYLSFQDFLVYGLFQFVETDYVLISQSDGWILNPSNWRDEWFNYDFIGGYTHAAFFPAEGDYYTQYSWVGKEGGLVVQNGGLSLRSRRFLEAPTKYGVMKVPMENKELLNEDIQLCCWMRPALEKVGMKFAPKEESMLFSFEHLCPDLHTDFDLTKILGQHSRFRRLLDHKTNKMTIDMPPEWIKVFPMEDKVIELFEHYGYDIDYIYKEPTEKKEEAPTAKIFVATPMYGGLCVGGYTVGLLNSVQEFMRHGMQMYYAHMMNESLITRARNTLAYDFLDTDATHMMFIDADITFNPADIVSMVNADKDIICGLYPKKEINWKTVAQAVKSGVEYQDLPSYTGSFVVNLVGNAAKATGGVNEPMEIDNGGTGFMLIKRNVFEVLKDKVPTYTNDMLLIVDKNPVKKIIHEFFATSIDEETNRLLSEDYHFCKIARQAGFKVYAAPWANLTHSGTYNFSGQLTRD